MPLASDPDGSSTRSSPASLRAKRPSAREPGAWTAMRGKVRRPELRRPISRQRLALIPPGEKGELLRVGGADRRQPLDCGCDRLVPFDLAELPGASLADTLERFLELRRRGLLHDAGGALAADHAAVNGMVPVALDVADRTVLQMHFDPAAARAHVTGRALHFVGDPRRSIDQLLRREIVTQPAGERHAPPREPKYRS